MLAPKAKRLREEVLESITTEELLKLVELKNKKNALLKQMDELDTEITNLHTKKEQATAAKQLSEQQLQMQQMEPFMAKMLSMSNHLEQLCTYTKELSSKVATLEDQKQILLSAPPKEQIELKSTIQTDDKHPVWIAAALQRRCSELEEFNRELSNLQLVLDCTNQNLSDYQTLLKLKNQL